MRKAVIIVLFLSSVSMLKSCMKDPPVPGMEEVCKPYSPTPYDLVNPEGFPKIKIPEDNPMTVEGIQLGRMLFFDPILSGDSTQSCGSCHAQLFGFSDNGKRFSKGIDGIEGDRNAMAVINLAWGKDFFWDGRAGSLEEQALGPVPNPIEMHLEWPEAVKRLKVHKGYPDLFRKAFGECGITSEKVAKAIAQFERTLISRNAKIDKITRGEADFTDAEQRGFDIFFQEPPFGADCFHCHGNILFTDNQFHNNGLDAASSYKNFTDPGKGAISGDTIDYGKFKTPTLRNIEFTAPYMHDGRFKTLEEVIDFYSGGLQYSTTIDPLMKKVHQGGVHLTDQQKQDLIAFLKTLSDTAFINNPDFKDPF